MSRLEELSKIIKSIDYNQLWDGFSKSNYALYNEKYFYLDDNSGVNLDLKKQGSYFIGAIDERFNGNTVISINDNYVAIWMKKPYLMALMQEC